MSSGRSSSKAFLTQGSPRTSSESSRSSSSRSSTYSNYSYSNYGYTNSESSATGRSGFSEEASSGRREYLRVPDPYPSKDGITKISRGTVYVINQEQRREDRQEPRSSDAKSSDYHKPSSARKPKK